ncbi:MAG: pyrroloquinoline quinone-dependent dehydrogenase [Planctomycetota bacterium]|jgi:quinoprotein glucose dehydrogenase|nr:pyrroloquinoline quinone-dependent dehydrogenase [Deltaproteobacteria bacterium]MDP6540351.1 pyrroloquinoline quinone-dependent dehydrogenase [Planctomycetota bacterium]
MPFSRRLAVVALLLALGAARAGADADVDWPHWGNDPGGMRYAPLDQIHAGNVAELEPLWTWNHGDVSDGSPPFQTTSSFQLTPIVVDGTLYGCTPFGRVFALDPMTGEERWIFDPGVDRHARWANQLVCRGVASWVDPELEPGAACKRRVVTNTVDARLIALDAATGEPCPGFGRAGQVDLNPGVGEQRWRGEYQLTSAPTVAGDVAVVGSAVSDNARINAPSGVIRGFDLRSGAMRWAWDLAPPDQPGGERDPASGWMLSTPNVWGPMSYDPRRDLLFVPTGNPTPDYASGHRQGLDYYGSSVVALHARTGKVAWHFQTVHHDVWDLDVPAQPVIFPMRRGGAVIPAVVQPTKQSFLFMFDRRSGTPLFPIEERPAPQSGEADFVLSPTQPWPVKPPPLIRMDIRPDDAFGLTFLGRGKCRKLIERSHFEGPFTPPTRQGTIMIPGNGGGSNWGGAAVDPERQILVANTMDLPWLVTLIPPDELARARAEKPGVEHAPQEGTPWAMRREILASPIGLPCSAPPYGQLHGIDLGTGELRWTVDVGEIPYLGIELGLPNVGGAMVTKSGLVFMAATVDTFFRAFDIETGAELWKTRLPAGGNAVPMSFRQDGRQVVVIAAGGFGRAPGVLGDALVAFALPEKD